MSNFAVVGVKSILINCIIGVNPEEQINPQDIIVDTSIEYDITKAALSDNIEDAISYVDLRDIATQLATTRKYKLLETFAVEFINQVEEKYKPLGVKSCYIKIKKPQVMKTTKYPFVELKREFQ
ncbi:hypothetical protein ABK040_015142 [Willaertia magna]